MEPTIRPTQQPKQKRGGWLPTGIQLLPRSEQERQHDDEAQRRAIQQKLFDRVQKAGVSKRPVGYQRPAYNTPQYWRDCANGWISNELQEQDHASYETRRRRAIDSKHNKAIAPHRHQRPAPTNSKQFSKPMSTQAARDDRLTPQAKALLQVIVARTGRGLSTDTTKTTLGVVMNRCSRSIQRYLQELIKFGYIRTQTRKSRRTGFFIGLRIWITCEVLPFFARNSAERPSPTSLHLLDNRRNSEETRLSPTNIKNTYMEVEGAKKPPWFASYAY